MFETDFVCKTGRTSVMWLCVHINTVRQHQHLGCRSVPPRRIQQHHRMAERVVLVQHHILRFFPFKNPSIRVEFSTRHHYYAPRTQHWLGGIGRSDCYTCRIVITKVKINQYWQATVIAGVIPPVVVPVGCPVVDSVVSLGCRHQHNGAQYNEYKILLHGFTDLLFNFIGIGFSRGGFPFGFLRAFVCHRMLCRWSVSRTHDTVIL